jgi:hypothetical protein
MNSPVLTLAELIFKSFFSETGESLPKHFGKLTQLLKSILQWRSGEMECCNDIYLVTITPVRQPN